MNWEEYRDAIDRRVSALDRKQKVALGLICCERVAPLCARFAEVDEWFDLDALTRSRLAARQWLLGGDVDFVTVDLEVGEAFDYFTDYFDFEEPVSEWAIYAFYGAKVHLNLVYQLKRDDAEPLLRILTTCYDLVDRHIQDQLDPDFQTTLVPDQIEQHALLRAEVDWQISHLDRLSQTVDPIRFLIDSNTMPIIDLG